MRLLNLATETAGSRPEVLPPPVEDGYRGIAFHWVTAVPPTGKRLKIAPTVPVLGWALGKVCWSVLNQDRSYSAPTTEVQQNQMLRHAAQIVTTQHNIPTSATVWYEICP